MQETAIYSKTLAGEEAMRERTLVGQRHLRTVLIIVDGVADVAALKRSIGEGAMVEAALAELEQLGLIEWRNRPEPATSPLPASVAPAPAVPTPVCLPVMTPSVVMAGTPSIRILPGFVPPARVVRSPRRQSRPQAPSALARALRAGQQMGIQAMPHLVAAIAWPLQYLRDLAYRRPGERRLGIAARLLLAGLMALALGVLALLAFPYDHYRPELERRLTLAFADTARIEAVRLAFTPWPALRLDGVSVGADGYATMDSIQLIPEPESLFDELRVQKVVVTGLRLREAGLGRLSQWLAPRATKDLALRQIELADVTVELAGASLGGLAGSALLDAGGGLAKLVLGSADGQLRAEAVARGSRIALAISANRWHPPFAPTRMVDALDLQAELWPGRLVVSGFDGRLYDGRIVGSGELSWQGGAMLAGSLEVRHLALGAFLATAAAEAAVEGSASATLRLSAQAATVAALADALRIEGPFGVAQGSLKHIDLAEAVRSAGSGRSLRGGVSRFEQLSGQMTLDAQALRLADLELVSGLMHAQGSAQLSRRSGTIAGNARVELKGSVGTVRASLEIAGRADEPAVMAHR